ncbi:MAG TPA: translation initiation factor IF-2 [Candidatus Polarisedimenticolia bacterium]|nr:translation initiation factor IF-2 [Candidatus Polarisedimenticolia bacterium]
MGKVRVGQIAKELNIKVTEAISRLKELGIDAKSNLSTIEEVVANRLRSEFGAARTAAKAAQPAAPKVPKIFTIKRPGAPVPPGVTLPVIPRPAPPAPPAIEPQAKGPGNAAPAPSTGRGPLPVRPGMPVAGRPGAPVTARPGPPQGITPGTRPAFPGQPPRPGTPAPGAAGVRPGQGPQRPGVAPVHGRGTTPGLRPAGPGLPSRPGSPPPRPAAPGAVRPGPVGGPRTAAEAARTMSAATAATPRPRPSSPPPPPPPPTRRPAPAPQRAPQVVKPAEPAPPPVPLVFTEIAITEGVTVKELAEKMGRKAKDIITRLLARGVMATMNQPLDTKMAQEICRELGFDAKVVSFEEEVATEEAKESLPGDLRGRDPVVTIMGHVDHGKTSLLDAVRSSNIVAGEAGGITQHIGAYHIRHKARGITFIDTPGHEAFTMMRARGARVTDIVVLVVAADDGVMPQTVEAMDHARAAGVPLVVAINKVDKPGANLDRVKKQLADHDLLTEDWGGKIVAVPISAKQKQGIDELLEMILLVADLGELKADPGSYAAGTILESRLDKSRGAVATALVQRGTLRVGDPFIAGAVHGKVRALYDDKGHRVKEAGPSIPVEVLGLEGVPKAGDPFQVLEEEWRVRQIGAFRQQKLRQEAMAKSSRLTLDHLHQQITEGNVRELPLVVKADVQGSVEALTKTLNDLPSDKVKTRVIHAGSGAITETDVLLASASNAIIVGYNVRPDRSAQELAEKEKVDLRLHSVIYDITNEIRNAMVGLLEPESKEVYLGRAEVRQLFKVPKVGTVAGCSVIDGKIARNADVRLLRDNVVIFTGRILSLRRFKDDASEVAKGYECGIGLANFNDVKTGDVIEAFRVEKVAVKSL